MTVQFTDRQLLLAFFRLGSMGQPVTARALAATSGLSRPALYQRLAHLDRSGLVDRRRLRLTLQGLAAACALAALERRSARWAA